MDEKSNSEILLSSIDSKEREKIIVTSQKSKFDVNKSQNDMQHKIAMKYLNIPRRSTISRRISNIEN